MSRDGSADGIGTLKSFLTYTLSFLNAMVTPFSRHFGHFVVAAEHAAQCLGVCGSARVFASPP
eukprot:COSAG06_NODE_51_length_28373_cov_30.746021_9_plen_63_part_00